MSLSARRELIEALRERYASARRGEKSRILDEFVQSTSYSRKHAIAVLGACSVERVPASVRRSASRERWYTDDVCELLTTIWEHSNRLCSKRLVPYLPTLIDVLERFGHISPTELQRNRLLTISPATVDRLLYDKRHGCARSMATTRPGPLLKGLIALRTFTDWGDDSAGFLEADTVAHCGTSMAGTYINTLVLTDVKTAWTECFALLFKDQDAIVKAIEHMRGRFPFEIRGLDTDNGSEFITKALVAWCEKERITFTRSRPYKKNDQCYVEQKNGNVVRRLVGYDRFEGMEAARILNDLYRLIRLYGNFFQPSMRLVSKSRQGAKTRRVYDRATTPFQRAMDSSEVDESRKSTLMSTNQTLDPVELLCGIRDAQNALWSLGYRALPSRSGRRAAQIRAIDVTDSTSETAEELPREFRRAKRKHKPHKKHKPFVKWWRTVPDAFAEVWGECETQLKTQPNIAAAVLFRRLQAKYPGRFKNGQKRTLTRRVRAWRLVHLHGPPTQFLGGDSLPGVEQLDLSVTCNNTSVEIAARYENR